MDTEIQGRSLFSDDQRILLVDHYHVGQRIALLQLHYLGLPADVVNSCRQAIKAVKKRHYDLVLIGWGMPQCDGNLCVAFVRRQEVRRNKHTAIVAVTAHAQPGDKARCLARGMDDLISKPIRTIDLHRLLCKHLRAA